MRYLSWIITIPLTLLAVSFAVSNLTVVELRLWPLPWQIDAPVYAVVMLAALLSFFIGVLVGKWGSWRNGRAVRAADAEILRLKTEVASLRKEAATTDMPPGQDVIIAPPSSYP